MTRLKVQCVEVRQTMDGFHYAFVPVTRGSPENEAFFRWTPSGKIEFGTTEVREFEVGYLYFIDIAKPQDIPVVG